jgi:PTS system mannose-specific IIB component
VNIVLARIDDRLIHGQVVVGWVAALTATQVAVISDAVAADAKQKALFKMAAPATLKVSALSVKDAGEWVQQPGEPGDKVILLFPSPREALALFELAPVFKILNVGGLRHGEGSRKVTHSVYLDEASIAVFRDLEAKGIKLEAQSAAGDGKVDMHPFLIPDVHEPPKNGRE